MKNKWYLIEFDRQWVKCKNYKCRAEFIKQFVERKHKCPICKMNNKGEIKSEQSAKARGE